MKLTELINDLQNIESMHGDMEAMLRVDDVLVHCEEFHLTKNVEMRRAEKAGGDYTIPLALILTDVA